MHVRTGGQISILVRVTTGCDGTVHSSAVRGGNAREGGVGLGWFGLGQGLCRTPWPTVSTRLCADTTGLGKSRLSGPKACRTVDRPRTPWWHTREGDAAVPVCVARAGQVGGACMLVACMLVAAPRLALAPRLARGGGGAAQARGSGAPPRRSSAQGGGTRSPPWAPLRWAEGQGPPPLCTPAQDGGKGSRPLCTSVQGGGIGPPPCAPQHRAEGQVPLPCAPQHRTEGQVLLPCAPQHRAEGQVPLPCAT